MPSIHCEKKEVSSRCDPFTACASATVSTSELRIPLSVYCESRLRRKLWKASSPISQRSIWKTIAPFSSVMDWNCGEKGSSRPSVLSGSVS